MTRSSEETRKNWKFLFDSIQSAAVVIGVLWAAYTYWDTRNRELQKPYAEKKLEFYTDAARVLAHLASSPSVKKEETESQFWELFWGELPFVESEKIKDSMEMFCNAYFADARCSKAAAEGMPKIAKNMSEQASAETRATWTGTSSIVSWFTERASSIFSWFTGRATHSQTPVY
jgi:hypothetical protein